MNHLSFTAYPEPASNSQINRMDPHYYDQTLAEDVGEQEKNYLSSLTHLNKT